MLDKRRSFRKTIIGAFISIALLAAAGIVYMNRQYAIDQITVWGFTPSANVDSLKQRISFTPKGTFYFYASKPQVSEASIFNKGCPRQEVGNPILGCYTAERIYVYDVTNTQLDGIEEVTAAHETLHAIWERTDSNEQERVGGLLKAEYQKRSTNDPSLVERMQYYQRTEPGEFVNELHSILGTEDSSLSPELETYYGQYFSQRQKVVDLHEKYNSVFNNLKKQSDALYAELTALSKNINARTIQYNADVKQLSADIDAFNTKAGSSDFASASQFNVQRTTLVARTQQVNTDRISVSNLIDIYNTKLGQYQELSTQIEALNKSIDSFNQLQVAPTVNK